MAAKFGTSGLRGLATELLGETTQRYVTGFAQHMLESGALQPDGSICVGWDFRASSPGIVADVAAALSRLGLKMVRCGALPTPALAAYAMQRNMPSIMVTGSHIPADRNGIKFYRPDGEIGKADEVAISTRAEALAKGWTMCAPVNQLGADETAVTSQEFLQRFDVIMPSGSLTGLRVGVYQHSTVARDLLVEVLQRAGATAVALDRAEVFIPVDTEAVSPETEALLQAHAASGEYDAFVSADGDGDRPLVADETGAVIRGDVVGMYTARFLGAETVVTPITSNSGIDAALGRPVQRTRVGSPYVIAAMQEAQVQNAKGIVGFEANGGFLTQTDFQFDAGVLTALPTRDSFLPILAVLATAASKRMALSALVAQDKMPVAHGGRLENFALDISARLLAELNTTTDRLSEFFAHVGSVASCNKLDGLRVALADGRTVHLRPSGNAPEFRCYVEASSMSEAKALLDWSFAAVNAYAARHSQ